MNKTKIVRLSIFPAMVTLGWSKLPLLPPSLLTLATGIVTALIFYSFVGNAKIIANLEESFMKGLKGILCFSLLLVGATIGALAGAWMILNSDIKLSQGEPLRSLISISLGIGGCGGFFSAIGFLTPIWITKRAHKV